MRLTLALLVLALAALVASTLMGDWPEALVAVAGVGLCLFNLRRRSQ